MVKFLVQYEKDHGWSHTKFHSVICAPASSSWRDLQKRFDPNYYYCHLQFFLLGDEIEFIQGH